MNIELSVVKLKTIIAWSCAHIVKNNIDIFIYTWYIQPYLFYEFVIMPILFDIHWHHSKLRFICYALVFHEANSFVQKKKLETEMHFFSPKKKKSSFRTRKFLLQVLHWRCQKNCIWICVKILNLIIWTNFISHQIMLTECSNINDLSS